MVVLLAFILEISRLTPFGVSFPCILISTLYYSVAIAIASVLDFVLFRKSRYWLILLLKFIN